jgi:hypothetical protein
MSLLLFISVLVFLINVPFGSWRARVPARSRQWFLAVHLPVPLVIALRVFSGLGFEPASFPLVVGAFFLGQYVGGKLPRLSFTRRLSAGGGRTR